jgi:hypothetical protein
VLTYGGSEALDVQHFRTSKQVTVRAMDPINAGFVADILQVKSAY